VQDHRRAQIQVVVAAGYGAAALGPGVSAPLALLPAPEPLGQTDIQRDPARRSVKPDGCAAYRLQIARDAGFLDC